MAVRSIVKIDEELCTGCGLCVTPCAEGAIEIIDGKAKVMKRSSATAPASASPSAPKAP